MPSLWWLPLLAPAATVVSAIAAGLYAYRTIYFNRETARMRATLDTIEKFASSDHYRECLLTFRTAFLASDPARRLDVDQLLNPTTADAVQVRFKILHLLCHYELIACGCGSGVLDKSFYAEYMRGALVHDWDVAQGFVMAMRAQQGGPHSTPRTIFANFEKIAFELKAEIAYEEFLRRRGRTEAEIKRIILACRRSPELLPGRP